MGILDLTFLSDIGLPLQIGVWKMDSPDGGTHGHILAMVVRVCAVFTLEPGPTVPAATM